MEKRVSNNCDVPKALTIEATTKRLLPHVKSLLNNLADRGIILNTWQALELAQEGNGNRGLGKTELAYVKIAESSKEDGFCISNIATAVLWDKDVISHHMYLEFVRGLEDFIQAYYSDVYTTKRSSRTELHLTPIKSNSRRWWNKGK